MRAPGERPYVPDHVGCVRVDSMVDLTREQILNLMLPSLEKILSVIETAEARQDEHGARDKAEAVAQTTEFIDLIRRGEAAYGPERTQVLMQHIDRIRAYFNSSKDENTGRYVPGREPPDYGIPRVTLGVGIAARTGGLKGNIFYGIQMRKEPGNNVLVQAGQYYTPDLTLLDLRHSPPSAKPRAAMAAFMLLVGNPLGTGLALSRLPRGFGNGERIKSYE